MRSEWMRRDEMDVMRSLCSDNTIAGAGTVDYMITESIEVDLMAQFVG